MSKLDTALAPSNNPTSVARRQGLPCPRCKKHHTKGYTPDGTWKCVGHNRHGDPCGNWAIRGHEVCYKSHGGSAEQVQAVAQRRLDYMAVEGEIARRLRSVDRAEQHPADGLLEVVRHAGGMVRMLGMLVGELDEESDIYMEVVGDGAKRGGNTGVVWRTRNAGLVGVDHEGDQAADIRATLYEKWARLYMQACKTALDADIDERMVRNATATSDRFFRALNAGLAAANLTGEQQSVLISTIANELRGSEVGATA